MTYKHLIEKGLLKEEKIDFMQAEKVLGKARNDLKSATILLDNSQNENAYELAYESMLSVGRALAFSMGLRPRAQGSHKIILEFLEIILGKDGDMTVVKFDKMRRKRHYLIYGSGLEISGLEAKNAIDNAKELIKKISSLIKNKNPQKSLL